MTDAFERLLAKQPVEPDPRIAKAKILTLDIETAPANVWTWGLFDQNIGINQVNDPGRMISFAAKWYGRPRMYFYSDFHHGHEEMVGRAWDLLHEADVLVHYNGISFDEKWLNLEMFLAGLTPPSPYKSVDLLRVVRKNFRFLSNKLDWVSQSTGIGSKVHHEGFPLWEACMAGDPRAWARMKRYNIGDVRLTENLYSVLRPWIPRHPHLGILADDELTCANCGSTDLQEDGVHTADLLVYVRYQCQHCGKWSYGPRVGKAGRTRGI